MTPAMQIKQRFAAGSFWLMLGALAGQLSGFVVFVLLARLLTPAEFGIVAFATIFIDLTRQVLSAGVPDALVRQPEWDDALASTALWLNLGMAAILVVACTALGAPLLERLGHAGSGPVFAVLSATLLVDAVRVVLDARLRREFAFKALSSREVGTQLVAGVAGIALAVAGAGLWALVAQRVLAVLLGLAATVWLVRWRPRLVFSTVQARQLLHFGAGLVGGQMFGQLTAQAAPLVVGVVLGPVPLALYRSGNRLLTMLTQVTITPLQAAALSAFSRIREQPVLAASYLRLTGACSLVACPVFVGVGAVATDLVVLLLGETWRAAGPIMAVSAVVVGASVLNLFFTPAMTAAGNARDPLRYYFWATLGNTAFAVAAAPYGATAVAASQTARAYAMLPLPLLSLRRTIGLSPWAALRNIAPPLLAALAMGAVMLWAAQGPLAALAAPARIALNAVLGAGTYGLLLLMFGRGFLLRNLAELKPFLPPTLRARFP